ncbi:thrombospondin type 3 repeat-containing protein [bacterium]|nr:thrombospondin type 3 repeat-containing protein [bacterium]
MRSYLLIALLCLLAACGTSTSSSSDNSSSNNLLTLTGPIARAVDHLSGSITIYDLEADKKVHDDALNFINTNNGVVVTADIVKLKPAKVYRFVLVFNYDGTPIAYVDITHTVANDANDTITFTADNIIYTTASASADILADISNDILPNLDSDGDGFSNFTEIRAGTNVNDQNSIPTGPQIGAVNSEVADDESIITLTVTVKDKLGIDTADILFPGNSYLQSVVDEKLSGTFGDVERTFTVSFNVQDASPGNLPFSIKATNMAGLSSSFSSSVIVPEGNSNRGPLIFIENLTEGQIISGTVQIQISAVDRDGVKSISVDQPSDLFDTSPASAFFTADWDTTSVGNGPIQLRVTATDNEDITSNKVVTLNVSNGTDASGPHITLRVYQSSDLSDEINYRNGDPIFGSVYFRVSAIDPSGLDIFEILNDDTIEGLFLEPLEVNGNPYDNTINTTLLGDNSTLKLIFSATDKLGYNTTAQFKLIVANNPFINSFTIDDAANAVVSEGDSVHFNWDVFNANQISILNVTASKTLAYNLSKTGEVSSIITSPATYRLTAVRTTNMGNNTVTKEVTVILDNDRDGIVNANDNCKNTINPNQADADGDHIGDVCDSDLDGDGVANGSDNCPSVANANQSNIDHDSMGDVCDDDVDGDGASEGNDLCPNDPRKASPGQCGCGIPDADADHDNIAVCFDACDNDAGKVAPGICGCGTPDTNTDGDTQVDCIETCDLDPNKLTPGVCGCGVADTDSDFDGTPNCHDNCPSDPGKTAVGICGCGVPDIDSDGDLVVDCRDNCPSDGNKINPGVCGCGVTDTNSDADSVIDCLDNCPLVANQSQTDFDGDAIGDACDTDRDGDGTPNGADNCPDIANDQNNIDGDALGDACDGDKDGDGRNNESDNCPNTPNANQQDLNGNGVGDACDGDPDGDGTLDTVDNCPGVYNANQTDMDGDDVGDVCDTDADGDGTLDANDNCPGLNNDQSNIDNDAFGDACDDDIDGDGFANAQDCGPSNAHSFPGNTRAYLSDDDYNCDGNARDIPANHATFIFNGGAGSYAGNGITYAGDVNNDGCSDILIGAPAYTTSDILGKVYLIYGHGLNCDYTTTLSQNISLASIGSTIPGAVFVTEQIGDRFGSNVAPAGDIDNDGCSDFLISADYFDSTVDGVVHPDSGKVYVLYGGGDGCNNQTLHGVFNISDISLTGNIRGHSFITKKDNARLGFSMAALGDINADGDTDFGFITLSPILDNAIIIYKNLTNLSYVVDTDMSQFGVLIPGDYSEIGGAGDFNHDAFMDIALTSIGYQRYGAVFVIKGSATGVIDVNINNADLYIAPDVGCQTGIEVSSVGDVNNDYFDDVLVGSNGCSNLDGIKSGRADIILGQQDVNLNLSDPLQNVITFDGVAYNDMAGYSLSGGDITGDNQSDLAIGADQADNSKGNVYVVNHELWLAGDRESLLFSTFRIYSTGNFLNTNHVSLNAGYHLNTLVTGDFNGDGKADLFIGNRSGGPINLFLSGY